MAQARSCPLASIFIQRQQSYTNRLATHAVVSCTEKSFASPTNSSHHIFRYSLSLRMSVLQVQVAILSCWIHAQSYAFENHRRCVHLPPYCPLHRKHCTCSCIELQVASPQHCCVLAIAFFSTSFRCKPCDLYLSNWASLTECMESCA